uniref:GATOR complex protein WDR24 n=1 Tax=Romanomermis culicivorax TaxID=13658 RepID=A0A915J0L2_ROMCU
MADYDVYDHSDIQPNCMDLDINGQKLILGGKKCLAVLNASDPEKAGAKLYRRNKFDVNCIKFCPHDDNKQQVIASSSQYYEIYNLRQSGIQMLATGKAHSRNVTDVDWDHFNSYQFATCSVDDSVNLWDVRDCKRPAQSFNIIAGAYQVKWCRKIEHIFATAHEGDVRLWDTRKTTSPIQFIAAHLSKVLSLDWHWKNEASFVSSSLDRTVKVFDFMKPNDPEIHFSTPGPVWKARFATFGDGAVLTIPFPQVGRTEHNVFLWNISAAPAASVVHTFGGYANVVLDFCVRNIPTNDDNVSENVVQLYTLCKDGSMRLWTIDGRMQTLCNQKSIFDSSSTKPNSFSDAVLPIDGRNFNFSNFMETFIDDNFQMAPLSSSSSINVVENSNGDNVFLGGGDQNRQKIGLEIPCSSPFNVFKMHGAPINWEKELITLSSIVLPNIMVEEINRENKTVVVLMKTKAYRPIRFRISSSLAYRKSLDDQQRQISLQFLSHPSVSTSISNNAKIQILKVFQESLSATRSDEEESSENESSDTQPSTESPNAASIGELFASYINARVPFPATCGARFCGPGYLVCFARKPESEICCGMPITQPGIVSCAISPRSYGDLLNLARERKEMQNDSQQQTYFATSIPRDPFSLSNFYYPNRQWIATRRKPRVDSATGLHYALDKVDLDDETCSDLHVYDCSKLFPFSKQLAQLYKCFLKTLLVGDLFGKSPD